MINSTRDHWALDDLQEEVLQLVPLGNKDYYNLCFVNRRLKEVYSRELDADVVLNYLKNGSAPDDVCFWESIVCFAATTASNQRLAAYVKDLHHIRRLARNRAHHHRNA